MSPVSSPQLRPLNIAELLDYSIRIYRGNFLKFLAIFGAAEAALLLLLKGLSWLLGYNLWLSNGSELFAALIKGQWELGFTRGISVLLQLVFISMLGNGILARATADVYLGRPLDLLHLHRRKFNYRSLFVTRLIGLIPMYGLLTLFNFSPLIFEVSPTVIMLIGILNQFILALLLVFFDLLTPIVVMENASPWNAFFRLFNLPFRRFWPLIQIFVILFLINIFIKIPFMLLSGPLQNWVGDLGLLSLDRQTASMATSTILNLLGSTLYQPLEIIIITLFYFDLRIRTEGFDLALAAECLARKNLSPADIYIPVPNPAPAIQGSADSGGKDFSRNTYRSDSSKPRRLNNARTRRKPSP